MSIPKPVSPRPLTTHPDAIELDVSSETGLLKQVFVHTPGEELERVAPEQRLNLLFDDILHVEHARKEHLLMCELFEKIVGGPRSVLQIGQFLREAFLQEEARYEFVSRWCDLLRDQNLPPFEPELKQLSAAELHHFALTGVSPLPIHAQPLPNLMFTRDVAAVVGDHIILSHAATAARSRESIITSIVLEYHPAFAAIRDRIIKLPRRVTFEGGDLLVVNPRVVLIGHSERTSFGGVLNVAKQLFERTAFEHIIMVSMPQQRSCMHLDTVFTFTSPDECVVFPPLIQLEDIGNIVRFTRIEGDPDTFSTTIRPSLKRALEEVLDRSLTFIPCGGDDELNQKREQWTDGANFFAIGPGLVIGYERNMRTFEEMRRHGYRIFTARNFLSYCEENTFVPGTGEKVAIKLVGHELSRGRGGPRCMTMPLSRHPLNAPA